MLKYLWPFFPVSGYVFIFIICKKAVKKELSPEAQARSEHRSHIGIFVGFTFSALLAVLLLSSENSSLHPGVVIYYLLVGYISLMASYKMQGYKFSMGLDLVATGLSDIGFLSLDLAIVTIILQISKQQSELLVVSIFMLLVWAGDYLYRIRILYNQLKDIS